MSVLFNSIFSEADELFLGRFATQVALETAHPTAEAGSFAIVMDVDSMFVYDLETTSWIQTTGGGGGGAVDSVNGQTGVVILDAADVGADVAHYDAIVATSGGDYATVGQAVSAGKKSIFVRKGTYVEDVIDVTLDGTVITGESKDLTILRFKTGQDGLRIKGANGTLVRNVTLDAQTNSAEAAYVIGDGSTAGTPFISKGNFNRLENCVVRGSPTTFGIYVAGASTSAGSQTLTYFYANDLQSGNVVENCELYSSWNGDAFSFSLQKDGVFSNNRVYGGRIAFYMTRNSHCDFNVVSESANQGIFVGAPSYDNTITNNAIYSPASSGFKFQNQLEHPVTGRNFLRNTVSGNTVVNAGGTAYEVNDSENNAFLGNTCYNPGIHGFYIQESSKNSFVGNSITDPNELGSPNRGSGFYLVSNVTDNVIEANVIEETRVGSPKMHTGISNREGNDCGGNSVIGNTIRGRNTERTVWFESDRTVISGNSIEGGNYAGIRLNNASDCTITGNVLRNNTNDSNNAYAEVWLQGSSSKNVIDGNVFVSSASNKAANGINIDGAGCASNKVGLNIFDGNLSANVSDTGTTTSLQEEPDFITFDTTPTGVPSTTPGTVSYNPDEGTLEAVLNGGSVLMEIGQKNYWYVRNNTGVTIPAGTAVYATGTIGASGRITVAPFIANGTIPAKFFLGVTTQAISNGVDGYVTTFGKIRGIDTSAFLDGDVLYVSASSAGQLTKVAPTTPNYIIPTAFVIHAHSNGVIAVRVPTLHEADEVPFNNTISGLSATNVKTAIDELASEKADKTVTVNGQPISGNVTLSASDVGAPSGSGTSTGTNTGDQDLSGLVPTSRTLTINGVSYDLSADRSWTISSGGEQIVPLQDYMGTSVIGVLGVFNFTSAKTLDEVTVTCDSIPVGSNLIVELRKNSTTSGNVLSSTLQVATSDTLTNGKKSASVTSFTSASIADGDYVVAYLTSVGSTTPAINPVVSVRFH